MPGPQSVPLLPSSSLQLPENTNIQNSCPHPPFFGGGENSELLCWHLLKVLGVNLRKEALELSLMNRAEFTSFGGQIVSGLGLSLPWSVQATIRSLAGAFIVHRGRLPL